MQYNLIYLGQFLNAHHAIMEQGLSYGFGDKFISLDNLTTKDGEVDCSGYSRALVYHGSGRQYVLKDGSWHQEKQVRQDGFQPFDYEDALTNFTNGIFICFYPPRIGRAGHVWLLRNSVAYHSFGGNGPGTTKGSISWLRHRVKTCYKLA